MSLAQIPREAPVQQQYSLEASRLASLTGTYRATLQTVRAGSVELSRFESAAFTARRSTAQVMAETFDVVRVVLVISGLIRVRQDGRLSSVAANHATVLRTTAAYQYSISQRSEVIIIAVPTSRLTASSRRNLRSVTAAEVYRPMLAETIVAFVRPLFAESTRSILQSELVYEAVMVSFVDSVVTGDTGVRGALDAGQEPDGEPTAGTTHLGAALVASATIVILDRIRAPDLSAATIASALGVSVRNLYRAFELESMSVGGLIRSTRLDMVAARLRANHSGRSFEQLSRDHGFSSTDVCARAFKSRFGVTMSVYESARRPAPAAASPLRPPKPLGPPRPAMRG